MQHLSQSYCALILNHIRCSKQQLHCRNMQCYQFWQVLINNIENLVKGMSFINVTTLLCFSDTVISPRDSMSALFCSYPYACPSPCHPANIMSGVVVYSESDSMRLILRKQDEETWMDDHSMEPKRVGKLNITIEPFQQAWKPNYTALYIYIKNKA